MWLKVLCVTLGGAVGAVARVELIRAIERVTPVWPINVGLLAVNLLGCFAFGVVWATLDRRAMLDSLWALVLLGGVLGAFTTFSSFAFEASALMQKAGAAWAAVQVIAHNVLGIGLIFAGLATGRWALGWGT